MGAGNERESVAAPIGLQGERVASWRYTPSSGVTELSDELRHWLGLEPLGPVKLEDLLAAIPLEERPHVEELLAARNAGYRSVGHRIDGRRGTLLVQHHIGYEPADGTVSGALLDVTARADMEAAMAFLARMVSGSDGTSFFQACVRHLAEIYQVRFAFVSLIDPGGSTATTVAVWAGGQFVDNFTYDLVGTPCQDVMNHEKELIPERASELYPDDHMLVDMGVDSYFGSPLTDSGGRVFGIVSVMDTKPMALSSWIAPVLAVFSSRVSVEVLRFKEDTSAREREARLAVEIAQAQRFEALGRLGGSVAHDFSNLLTVVVINAEELQRLDLPPDAAQRLKEILEVSENGKTLVNRLLAFGRKQERLPRRIDLNSAIRSQGDVLARLAGSQVELLFELSPEPLWTLFDAGELEQILLNLVVNARDAMPDGGTISILTSALEGHLVSMSVSDSGHGIPESVRHRIFEPNFTTKKDQGTGLGLATVFNILRGVGGDIRVESIVDHGTTMQICIPRHD